MFFYPKEYDLGKVEYAIVVVSVAMIVAVVPFTLGDHIENVFRDALASYSH